MSGSRFNLLYSSDVHYHVPKRRKLTAIFTRRVIGTALCNVQYHTCLTRVDLSGFLGASVAAAVIVVGVHHVKSGLKNIRIGRLGLMSLFLGMVAMFVGGQTAALTFTSVSRACMARNMALTAGDQLAHIAGAIIGMVLIMRAPSRVGTMGLLAWTVVRFGLFLTSNLAY